MSPHMEEMEKEKLKSYYNVAMELVLQCGSVMRQGYEKLQFDYEVKGAFYDLVTVYDKQIEDFLISGLKAEFPESKFMGEEESAASQRKAVLTDEPTWIIDPIDGTTNFIHRIPNCCISVGLAINKELVVGIIFNPIENEMYSARKGHGAYLNGQRICTSKCITMNKAIVAYEMSLIHDAALRDKHVKRCSKLASNARGVRCFGSAALTLCYLAKGSIDCFPIEDLDPWDIAAGILLLREAGGAVYTIDGGEFNVMEPKLVCAATNELGKEVLQYVKEASQITEYTFK